MSIALSLKTRVKRLEDAVNAPQAPASLAVGRADSLRLDRPPLDCAWIYAEPGAEPGTFAYALQRFARGPNGGKS